MLQISGEVTAEEITGFAQKEAVEAIWAEDTAVFPEDCSTLFADFTSCQSIDLSLADTSRVTDMREMFRGCTSLHTVTLDELDTGHVVTMAGMFRGCTALPDIELYGWDTHSVEDMSGMFYGCTSLLFLYTGGMDTGAVRTMAGMFRDCAVLSDLELTGLDTSAVTDMSGMFRGCASLSRLDLTGFDTSAVTDMREMFRDCAVLSDLEQMVLDTAAVTDMSGMFRGCGSFQELDLSTFRSDSLVTMAHMFDGCTLLRTVDLDAFALDRVSDKTDVFANCGMLELLRVGPQTGSITEEMALRNGYGWVTDEDLETCISGDGTYAVIAGGSAGSSGYYCRLFSPLPAQVRLYIPTLYAAPGETVRCPVFVERNPGYDTISLTMQFGPSLAVRKESGVANGAYTISGPAALTGSNIATVNQSAGWISFVDTGKATTNTGALFSVFFTVPEKAGDYPLTVSASAASLDGAQIDMRTQDGCIRVQAPVKGDVNFDGAVTVADAVLLQKRLLTAADALPYWRNADMNDDACLNVLDLCLLKQVLTQQN